VPAPVPAAGTVVVDAGTVVVVVVDGVVVVVVVEGGTVVVVVVVVVVVEVVVVVVELVVVGGVGLNRFPAEVPPVEGLAPIREDSGCPATSSTTVTAASATAKTTAADSATARQLERRRARPGPPLSPSRPRRAAALPVLLEATNRTSPVSRLAPAPVPSAASGAARSPAGAPPGAPPGAARSPPAVPAAPVSPRPAAGDETETSTADDSEAAPVTVPDGSVLGPRCRNGTGPPPFTTTWRTALWVRSIQSPTRALALVATMLPIATPMTVPFTPKVDAITAEATAPHAEAAICIGLSFMAEGDATAGQPGRRGRGGPASPPPAA
jgi:hypothetical protein